MDLREYMFRHRLRVKDMAELLNCSRQQISAIKAGKKCGIWFARALEQATNGEVSAEETRNGYVPSYEKEKNDSFLDGK